MRSEIIPSFILQLGFCPNNLIRSMQNIQMRCLTGIENDLDDMTYNTSLNEENTERKMFFINS